MLVSVFRVVKQDSTLASSGDFRAEMTWHSHISDSEQAAELLLERVTAFIVL